MARVASKSTQRCEDNPETLISEFPPETSNGTVKTSETSNTIPGEYVATCHWRQDIEGCATLDLYHGMRVFVKWMDGEGNWAFAHLANVSDQAGGYVPQSV